MELGTTGQYHEIMYTGGFAGQMHKVAEWQEGTELHNSLTT